MATFGELKTKIANRLKDPSNIAVTDSQLGDVINESIQFWSKRRYWFNEFEETKALVSNDPVIPALTTTPLYIFKDGGMTINYASTRWPLTKISPSEYDDINDQGRGIPFAYTFRNDQYEVYYYPEQTFNLVVRGVEKYADLSASGNSNDFTINAPDLILYEALSRTYAEFRQDEKMESYYQARALNEHKAITARTSRNNSSGRLNVRGF